MLKFADGARHFERNSETLRYFCLISDYDGTLAHDGQVTASTLEALKRVKASGRKLVLATGRELPDLLRVFPETRAFRPGGGGKWRAALLPGHW